MMPSPPPPPLEYPIIVEPIRQADGGGYCGRVPDLPGCLSDGATPEEAMANLRAAIRVWAEAAHELGRTMPEPSRTLPIS